MIVFKTETGSVYQWDREQGRIRRLSGDMPPTSRVGDGWKTAIHVHLEVGRSAVIVWAITDEGISQTTVTSFVVEINHAELN
jgi:hypothetical protein